MTGMPTIARAVWGLVLIGLAASGASGDDSPGPSPTGGMRAYADPRTHVLRDRPLPGEPPPGGGVSRSGAGLIEVPAPGGGVMMHLQGRFRSPVVATVGPDGKVRIDHETPGE